jgi:small subunit ribosomal protein S15
MRSLGGSMSLKKDVKIKLVKEHQTKKDDTGSCEVQVALLTAKINTLTEHFKGHAKDHHSRFGLIRMVERRKKLLKYLEREYPDRYKALIKKLDLRK